MIIMTNNDKLDKVNRSLFKIINISTQESKDNGIWDMTMLLPPANLLINRRNGNIGKKKFKKEYIKFLSEKNTLVENTIYTLALSLKEKNSLCFTCTDEEYDLGYIQILCDYLEERFGVQAVKIKDAVSEIKSTIDMMDMSKKEKKLIKTDDEELSEKKINLKNKLLKYINKEIKSVFSYEGTEYFENLDNAYAVDQAILALTSKGAIKITDNGNIKIINPDNIGKSSAIITAIVATKESNKQLKKVINSVLDSHDISIKKLKKFSKPELVTLLIEIYGKLTDYRSGKSDEE